MLILGCSVAADCARAAPCLCKLSTTPALESPLVKQKYIRGWQEHGQLAARSAWPSSWVQVTYSYRQQQLFRIGAVQQHPRFSYPHFMRRRLIVPSLGRYSHRSRAGSAACISMQPDWAVLRLTLLLCTMYAISDVLCAMTRLMRAVEIECVLGWPLWSNVLKRAPWGWA